MSLTSPIMEASKSTIIGIDPGLAITGYAVITNHPAKVLEYGVIRTPAKVALGKRLALLYSELQPLLKKYRPKVAGCEKVFFTKNVKTSIDVNQARGVIMLALEQHHARLTELTPTQIKKAVTGYGAANKTQVQYMTQHILNLVDTPTQDDAADALAIAIAVSAL